MSNEENLRERLSPIVGVILREYDSYGPDVLRGRVGENDDVARVRKSVEGYHQLNSRGIHDRIIPGTFLDGHFEKVLAYVFEGLSEKVFK